jgi:glutaminyl-tRNA synthetase
LKHAYYVTCKEVIKDENGDVVRLICTYDPATKGGWTNDGRKVKGTSHWVSKEQAVDVEVRLYEHLFTKTDPMDVEEGEDYTANLNPDSMKVLTGVKAEPSLIDACVKDRFQFLRQGYFCPDYDFKKEKPVFNLIVRLKDSYRAG